MSISFKTQFLLTLEMTKMIKYISQKISTSFSSPYYHLDARCLFSENVVERYGITHSNKTKMREIFNKTSSILATDSI